ncbi:LCI family antimicrobial peptide [Bacillus cereus]|uniref:LCI fold domain-containing protein n=1 Tax=Bacillus cereus TaxID=1396 RepID=A0ABD7DPW7_BACCE|nr:LCI fold-containing protein [Bacillus cereus]MCU4948673.1 antimicrobial peptide LCI [Bacillus cereus]MED4645689.1 LCI family antimicrobial peptide [Bacillus cereus]QRY18629.1 hypothetical protein JTF64_29325 [Bacillus cereus]
MFKKLVVGVLATGFVLTGGMGASAATSTVDNTNKKLDSSQFLPNEVYPYEDFCPQSKAHLKMAIKNENGIFANAFTDSTGITWYFKSFGKYGERTIGCYEGTRY